jgi:hypothetical protein
MGETEFATKDLAGSWRDSVPFLLCISWILQIGFFTEFRQPSAQARWAQGTFEPAARTIARTVD